MTLKPCLVCGQPSDRTRCPEHQPKPAAQPSAHQRGYTTRWTQLSKKARKLQPWCTDCGATEDLQTNHSPEAWQRKAAGKPIKLSMLSVVRGPCNRRRGAARGPQTRAGEPSRDRPNRAAKAQPALHTPKGYAC